jgi:2-keto-3-deoxy-L-rhamnonate aldolase RhmA
MNNFRQLIQGKRPLVGALMSNSLPISYIEQLGMIGYDFVWIDAEHGTIMPSDTEAIYTAAERRGMSTLTRVPLHDSANIQRFLDCGTQSILFPQIHSRIDAECAVSKCRFPPLGERGLASARWNNFLLNKGSNFADSIKAVNESNDLVIGVQIETKEGLKNARAIIETDGVDFVFLGPADLSVSLGVPGKLNHDKVVTAMKDVKAIADEVGKPLGTLMVSRQDYKLWAKEYGFVVNVAVVSQMFTMGAKSLLQGMK